MKPLGNENSYTPEFFEELFPKIGLTDQSQKYILKRTIILATQAYVRNYSDYVREPPPYKIKEELEKSQAHIEKAISSLTKVCTSQHYSEAFINNLFDVIDKQYRSLHNLRDVIIPPDDFITSPIRSLAILSAMEDGIKQTLENFEHENTPNKSEALYHWIMILSAKLEPILGRKLEQSRYHEGEYISKREISDSELLLFVIKPLDPNVTQSQIETAIKDTHKERRNAPWDNYFPM